LQVHRAPPHEIYNDFVWLLTRSGYSKTVTSYCLPWRLSNILKPMLPRFTAVIGYWH